MARFHTPSVGIPISRLNLFPMRQLFLPGLIAVSVVVPLLFFAAGVGVRQGKGTPVVINEVYLDHHPADEWVELLNTTGQPIDLAGWQLGNRRGAVARLGGLLAPGVLMVVRPQVGGWDPSGDAVLLWAPASRMADSIGWGKQTPAAVPAVPTVKAGRSLTRNPQGLDSDTAADWVLTRPSPGTQSPASLSVGMHRLLFAATNYVSLIGGLLLWSSFLLIGLIARRFEALTGQPAYWMAMVVAPAGIVIYNAIQSYAFFTAGRMSDCSAGLSFAQCQQGWAFMPLLLSGIAMAFVVYHFYGIAHRILDLRGA